MNCETWPIEIHVLLTTKPKKSGKTCRKCKQKLQLVNCDVRYTVACYVITKLTNSNSHAKLSKSKNQKLKIKIIFLHSVPANHLSAIANMWKPLHKINRFHIWSIVPNLNQNCCFSHLRDTILTACDTNPVLCETRHDW